MLTLLLSSFFQSATVSNGIAVQPLVAEYKNCTSPGEYKTVDADTSFVCARGLNGKLLWLYPTWYDYRYPGSPEMRQCATAGDRKILEYWTSTPLDKDKGQFVCITINSTLLKSEILKKSSCYIDNDTDNGGEPNVGRCKIGPWKIGQKVWVRIIVGKPFTNVVRPSQFASAPSVKFVTKDVPEIPSCYLEKSCDPNLQAKFQAVAKAYPNAIIHPARNLVPNSSHSPRPPKSPAPARDDCSKISGTLVDSTIGDLKLDIVNPFSCQILLEITGQVNCKATWVPIPVSATMLMLPRESASWNWPSIFQSARSTCESYMKLNGLQYDGSGGLSICTTKSCLSLFRFVGRVI
jgi:hypothetical protein